MNQLKTDLRQFIIDNFLFGDVGPECTDDISFRDKGIIDSTGVLADASDPAWLTLLAGSSIKRFVPLARMHHFCPLWAGANFWRQTFEEVELDL